MIKLKTDCVNCMHEKICRYKHNPRNAMNKLKNMTYGNGPNDDYDWDTMMQSQHVIIEFSCPDYKLDQGINIRTI